jgi:hypothetical protein
MLASANVAKDLPRRRNRGAAAHSPEHRARRDGIVRIQVHDTRQVAAVHRVHELAHQSRGSFV